jgi:ATP-dependent Clp protease ATP-binding subunit ClpX
MRGNRLIDAAITSSLLETVESSDLIAYGLIPEFIGRFPVLVSLAALDEDQLVQVLTEPRNALGKQYKKMFAMNNVKLQTFIHSVPAWLACLLPVFTEFSLVTSHGPH